MVAAVFYWCSFGNRQRFLVEIIFECSPYALVREGSQKNTAFAGAVQSLVAVLLGHAQHTQGNGGNPVLDSYIWRGCPLSSEQHLGLASSPNSQVVLDSTRHDGGLAAGESGLS